MAEWYVRPDASHGGTNAGTSYANAWQGWSSIVWGVGGVVGGDTLYVCGAHSYAAGISVGAHGGSSEATRCTISGAYAADPGRLTFTGAVYLNLARAWTSVEDIAFVRGDFPAVVHSAAGTNCQYRRCDFAGNGTPYNTSLLHIYAVNGETHSNILIEDCVFHDHERVSVTGEGTAIEWFITPVGAACILSGLTIRGCTFDQIKNGRAVVGLRAEDDTSGLSRIDEFVFEDNSFSNCTGILVEAGVSHTSVGQCGSAVIRWNVAENCAESPGALGGMLSLLSWASLRVYGNGARGIAGPTGFCNIFYCLSPRVYGNVVDGVDTSTIDGNGVLFDHGNVGGAVYGNVFKNLRGKVGIPYSGVGIMLLDSVDASAFGNLCITVKTGIHVGNSTGGQSGGIYNNTFVDIKEYGVHTTASASALNSVEVKNNVFHGTGYSVFDQSGVAWTGENYNVFHGFTSGTSNHTFGSNSITSDPLLDASYRPLPGSPCIGTGVYIAGAKHMGGMPMNASSPDIGAYRNLPERTIALTRAI